MRFGFAIGDLLEPTSRRLAAADSTLQVSSASVSAPVLQHRRQLRLPLRRARDVATARPAAGTHWAHLLHAARHAERVHKPRGLTQRCLVVCCVQASTDGTLLCAPLGVVLLHHSLRWWLRHMFECSSAWDGGGHDWFVCLHALDGRPRLLSRTAFKMTSSACCGGGCWSTGGLLSLWCIVGMLVAACGAVGQSVATSGDASEHLYHNPGR